MVIIKEVKTKKEIKEFINFPLKMYKKNPYFVPPLYGDEKQLFSKKYVYYDTCEAIYYNAYIGDKIVGRISGIIQHSSNSLRNEKRVRFTRFDCINNQDVANSLFSAVEKWAKEKGMDTIHGPLGFSDLEREGLLIEGFNELSTFEEQYNYPYYQTLIENYGFVKETDWVERKIYAPKEFDYKLERVSNLMLEKHKLRFTDCKNIKEFLKRYADQIFEIIDITYKDLYGTVPFTDGMKKMLISNFSLLISIDKVAAIVDENDKVVCFGLCMPSIAKAVKKSNGHLTPLTILRILKAKRSPKIIDLCLFGVLPEYAMKGVSSAITAHVMRLLSKDKVEYAETNLNLEDNYNIQNQWKRFDTVLHKRRRAFVKKIN